MSCLYNLAIKVCGIHILFVCVCMTHSIPRCPPQHQISPLTHSPTPTPQQPTPPQTKACDAGGEWKTAVKLVEAMRQGGMHPDLYSFNTAISACQKVRDTTTHKHTTTTPLLHPYPTSPTSHKLTTDNRHPTKTTTTTGQQSPANHAAAHTHTHAHAHTHPSIPQASKVRQITRLLARMEEDYPPVPPNAYTFITATTACLQAGAFDKLFEVRGWVAGVWCWNRGGVWVGRVCVWGGGGGWMCFVFAGWGAIIFASAHSHNHPSTYPPIQSHAPHQYPNALLPSQIPPPKKKTAIGAGRHRPQRVHRHSGRPLLSRLAPQVSQRGPVA
jgi:hypothetical protein